MSDQYIPYVELPARLDVKADDILLVSSDITKIAMTALRFEKNFAPSKFIDALKEKLRSGTLLFPAFVNRLESGDTFDLKNTVPETGALSLAAFKDPDFIRTTDPFHSFMVWGKVANELVSIKNKSTFGDDSVFSVLHQRKAKMLLIDVDLQHSFTFAHYVEEKEKVKYRKFKKYTIDCIPVFDHVNEKRDISVFEKKPDVMLNLNGLYELFKKKGALKEYHINGSLFTLIDLEKSVEIIKEDIRLNRAQNLRKRSLVLWLKTMLKKLRP